MPFIFQVLDKSHNRASYACGNDKIDAYFHHAVSQDVKRAYATCVVAMHPNSMQIAGFYTLSSGGISLADVPEQFARKLPKYPSVPAVLIGWLARHIDFAGQGLGELLVADAIRMVMSSRVGTYAVYVHAIDDAANQFYQSLGFVPFSDRCDSLFLPLAKARRFVD